MASQSGLPKWVSIDDALEIEGSSNARQLTNWIDRWNSNPSTENKVKRRYGKVEMHSLLAALEEDSRGYDKGAINQEAYLAIEDDGRKRRPAKSKTTHSMKGARH